MRMWVFSDEMLARALAEFEARRQREGASEQQAKDDTATIVAFLGSSEVAEHKMLMQGRA